MNHALVAPVLVPLLAAVLLMFLHEQPRASRVTAALATLLQLAFAVVLVRHAVHTPWEVYALGNWPAPFGIVLVLDRLSALMLLTTALLAAFCLWYAIDVDDRRGRYFHALLQFQLMGLNGAFLTGDLFNLFVFFEVLLIASYGLLLHGGGRERMRAGLHYVAINLAGSALFLIGVGALYAVTGTLNIADLTVRASALQGGAAAVAQVGALLLLVVFALKAAAFPLYLWLPHAYPAACASVAALFAIMTKLGIYAIVRVHGTVFGPPAAQAAPDLGQWLLPSGIATMLFAILGVMASPDLRRMSAYLTVLSIGILLCSLALGTPAALASALYYLVHSTFGAAALFLLAGLVAEARGALRDRLQHALGPQLSPGLALLFLFGALAIAGVPPLSGFLGKTMVLQATRGSALVWSAILITSFLSVLALARAGIILFWEVAPADPKQARRMPGGWPAALGLSLCLAGLAVFADPVRRYADAAAAQIADRSGYVRAVLLR